MESRAPIEVTDTRRQLLKAAKRLFAERGFYGASIAQIAEELGITKQALLHHFGYMERLYDEVMIQMAEDLARVVAKAQALDPDPKRQLEALLVKLYGNLFEHPQDTQLLMRELLDNRSRAEHAHSWRMKGFLDALTAMVAKASPRLARAEALARVYLVLGAINYVAVSEPTLKQMYPELGGLKAQFPAEVRRLVQLYLESP